VHQWHSKIGGAFAKAKWRANFAVSVACTC